MQVLLRWGTAGQLRLVVFSSVRARIGKAGYKPKIQRRKTNVSISMEIGQPY